MLCQQLGQIGEVLQVLSFGKIEVGVNGTGFLYSPKCLLPTSGGANSKACTAGRDEFMYRVSVRGCVACRLYLGILLYPDNFS